MAEKPNIVCVVAHPDDVAHAMGGTGLLLKERYKLNVICLTKGERGIKGTPFDEAGRIREAEERAACRLLDADVTFTGEINGDLYAGKELCRRVSDQVKALEPAALFTLWPINSHPDHSACYEIAMQALHMAEMYYTCEVYMIENAIGGQTGQFIPDIYVDISSVIETKEKLIRCHASQNPTEERVQSVLLRSTIRGKFACCQHAEGFKTLRPVANRRYDRKSDYLLLAL